MKTRISFFFQTIMVLTSICVWTACSNDDELLTPSSGQEVQNDSMKMNFLVSLTPFDGLKATRADEWTWVDGATVFIQFYSGSSRIRGHAVYSKSTDSWDASYNGEIASSDKCEVYYFEGADASDKKSVIITDATPVYVDKSATYAVSNGTITLEAALAPITSRIRFTGSSGLSMTLWGITHYTGYNAENNTLTTSASSLNRTVESSGTTSYIYGVFTDQAKRQFTITNSIDLVAFTKSFAATVMKIGESGYMTLPTEDANKGWSIDKSKDPLGFCTDGNHPHQIDMGTGVKFACCNVGATSPIEYGDYFAWGETTTKNTYNWSTYKWCNGSSSSMTKYCDDSSYGTVDNKTKLELADDAARANWGGTWRMPTIDELETLNSDCTWTWTTIREVKGYKVTAKNGNVLFFPAAGNRYEAGLSEAGSRGYYWSSSLTGPWADDASELYFYSNDHRRSYVSRDHGLSVRPVSE